MEKRKLLINLLVGWLIFVAIPIVSAEPLIIATKVTPDNAEVGDTIGIYLTIQGRETEDIQIVTELRAPVFKVVDLISGKGIDFTQIKENAIDLQIERGQTIQITIIGEITHAKTLATIFPNAFSIKSSFRQTSTVSEHPTLDIRKLAGSLHAKYLSIRDSIPERMQLIVEEKFRKAEEAINSGRSEEANAILNELEGIITEYEKKRSDDEFQRNVLTIVILVAGISGSIVVWRLLFRQNSDENRPANFRLMR
ncbi:MAG: hypothetical protein H0Z28_13605 [Archaeoglobus sp.]|nr:hypothetical protein [Archaeoglobus sp.]